MFTNLYSPNRLSMVGSVARNGIRLFRLVHIDLNLPQKLTGILWRYPLLFAMAKTKRMPGFQTATLDPKVLNLEARSGRVCDSKPFRLMA